MVFIPHRGQVRLEAPDLLFHSSNVLAAGQGHDPESVRIPGGDLQGLDPDGTGGAEDGDGFHSSR
jgi:hypothetical protein